ncbi:hypothetical protein [Oscillatoria salina]|uniref:hypothetical protein n=1 Tax=Oscillatoria salina TaxID=331517 RepID=UPI001CCFD22E|nr:hypothetical protein [Oscillatoria salina]MBZ8179733.1 hypothetical protein [Oscillatoria salina IIICB1]
MCFDILMLSGCLLPGKTSFKEEGVSINIQPESGETILFFSIDDQVNTQCKLRQLLGMNKEKTRICDLLVFYAKEDRRIICFVELKRSGKLGDAVEQVINTSKYFQQFLNKNKYLNQSNYLSKAFIILEGSVPKEYQEYKDKLDNAFGKNNYDHNGRSTDFGNFLRGTGGIPREYKKGKRKKSK